MPVAYNQQGLIAISVTIALHLLIVSGLWFYDSLNIKQDRVFRADQNIVATLLTLEQVKELNQSETKNVTDLAKQRREQERLRRKQQRKAEQEKLRSKKLNEQKQAEAKAKLEKEQLRQEALLQQRREQAQLEAEQAEQEWLESAINSEWQSQQVAEKERVQAQKMANYQQYIYQQIRGQWIRPHSARNGMKVTLSVNLVPTGYVNSVAVINSSGDEGFDRSALQAIKKAEPFAQLQELSSREFERFFRNFKILFNPQDLRQ